MTQGNLLLAVDIGGTFTDIVLLNIDAQEIAIGKVLTSYPDLSEAVLSGVQQLLETHGIMPGDMRQVIHGTTLVANTLIERKGAKTALITTQGFRDALEIGNEGRYDLYDLGLIKPQPLVERRLRIGVPERMTAKGEVLHKLDEAAVNAICETLREEGIESVAVCLLHAYANAQHENQVAQILAKNFPEMAASLSHQVSPAMREYQRSSTTVANAYVQPITERYLERLRNGLSDAGVAAPLNVMLSSGGTTTIETATDFPIRLVESGPSGGALAGVYWGKQVGYEDILAFDMGGTTAKAVLTEKGELGITTEAEVAHVHRFKRGSGFPLMVPMIEMIEIGAGGGSIAHLNNLGLPAVGPESAGSTPGPVCYDQGGTQPTVTDADLTIGYLNLEYFAAGSIALNDTAAHASFESLAADIGTTVEKAAWGIHQLVNENMAAAARVHGAERGLDVQRYAMVATGGAGPVHASGVAERLNIQHVIVPPLAGVGSAFGFLLAPTSFDFTRSYLTQLESVDLDLLNAILKELEAEGRDIVKKAGVPDEQITVERSVDMRYLRQGYEIRVPFAAGSVNEAGIQAIQQGFEEEYKRFYGILCEGVPIQAVNWRVVISGPKLGLNAASLQIGIDNQITNQPYSTRKIIFNPDDSPAEVPVYRREALSKQFNTHGPAVIEEAESTTIVLPGWSVEVHESGCLLLTNQKKGA